METFWKGHCHHTNNSEPHLKALNGIEMGLKTSHNCWNGPYSTFNRFRELLALQIGISDLPKWQNAGGVTDHGIFALLDHSDCDGTLSPEEAQKIADGLTAIIENNTVAEWVKERAIIFRDGCLDAVSKNETIEFN